MADLSNSDCYMVDFVVEAVILVLDCYTAVLAFESGLPVFDFVLGGYYS